MYFKKTRCPNCDSLHDEMNECCPYCHTVNETNAEFRKKHPMSFVPWYKELIFALVGLVGFTVINLFVSLILLLFLGEGYGEDEAYALMLINTLSYVIFFIIVCALLIPNWRVILNKFKIPMAYLFGAIGFIVLVSFSIGYGYLVDFIYPSGGEGGNQSAVSEMVINYPIISFIIVGFVGPICEEIAYRVGLFTLFRRVHPVLAYAGSALIFGLIHFDFFNPDILVEFLNLPHYVFAGLCFGFLYERKGLAASTTAHILNNLLSIVMIIIATRV